MGSLNSWLVIAGGTLAVCLPATAHAQLDDRTIVSIMRECRKIADDTARTACYDNIPIGAVASAPAPQQPMPPAPPAPQAPAGLGAEQVPAPPRPAQTGQDTARSDRATPTVTAAEEREPGIYLLTLDDGAQWQFVDSAPPAYNPPRAGSEVEIRSAALGSYQLRYADQRPIRIRRVR